MAGEYIQDRSDAARLGLRDRLSMKLGMILALCMMISAAFPSVANGQISKILQSRGFQGPPQGGASASNSKVMPSQLKDVGIDQLLNNQVPLDLVFHDEAGKVVRLGDYFGKKPVIISLIYFNCPQLCPMVENGLLESLKEVRFDIGDQFNVLTVSFDPKDSPADAFSKRAAYLSMYNRKGAASGWHFLTGDEASITTLAKALGFHYKYDPQTQQFSHATAIIVLTPQGKVARYLYGIRYPAGAVRLALVEASQGKIGNPVDAVLLYCSHYDPATGKYSMLISRVLFIGALITVILLGGLLLVLFRSGPKRQGGVLITQASAKAER
ncbi:MAG TPA: SCO family protein [Terriglobia bacterium]|nr:SCO family protein [Terriglobia bacterium]